MAITPAYLSNPTVEFQAVSNDGVLGDYPVSIIPTDPGICRYAASYEVPVVSASSPEKLLLENANTLPGRGAETANVSVPSLGKSSVAEQGKKPRASNGAFYIGEMKVETGGNREPRISTHGRPFMTQTDRPVAASVLAEQLKRYLDTQAQSKGPLIMVSCYSAVGGKVASQAQVLANALGRPVVGFSGKVNDRADTGRKIFQPQSGFVKARTMFLNSMLYYPAKVSLEIQRLFLPPLHP